MQKKLERLDSIIRDAYGNWGIKHDTYMEATKLLTKLSNELKLLNLACVTQQRELLIAYEEYTHGQNNTLSTEELVDGFLAK